MNLTALQKLYERQKEKNEEYPGQLLMAAGLWILNLSEICGGSWLVKKSFASVKIASSSTQTNPKVCCIF